MKYLVVAFAFVVGSQAFADTKVCTDNSTHQVVAVVSTVANSGMQVVDLRQALLIDQEFGTLPVGVYNFGNKNPLNHNRRILETCNEGAYLDVSRYLGHSAHSIYLVCGIDSAPGFAISLKANLDCR